VHRGEPHARELRHDVAAQVEFQSKIEAKLKALYLILVLSAKFQALATWV
jgi:hypothetical protein